MNNFYRFLSLTLSLLASVTVFAEQVTEDEALQKAQQFMPGKQFKQSAPTPSARASGIGASRPYYIFNAEDNGGYVLVSGDDRTIAILGYSRTGNLDLSDIPDNLRYWLDSYARQIESLNHGFTPAKISTNRISRDAIEPLIQTQWNQFTPYNNQCPKDPSTNLTCVTGCVATAMAQVFNYHKWPEHCPALPSYRTNKENIYVPSLPATDFKWSLMKDTYSNGETGEAAEAVAELMRYCGQAVQMDYTSKESGAYADPQILKDVFDYDDNLTEIYRNEYTDEEEWENLIYQELDEGRPVFYSGTPPENTGGSGHAFICDGYDGYGRFHINWGWGGHRDDYYVLSIANPYDEEDFGFSEYQVAIIGMKPKISASDYDVTKVTFSEDIFVNEETTATISLKNMGITPRERIFLWIKQNRVWKKIASTNATIAAQKSGEAVLTFTPTSVGSYEVKITSDYEGSTVKATATIQVVTPVEVTSGDFVYYTNPTTRHAILKKMNNQWQHQRVNIPETFESEGTTYQVIGIAKDAFIQNKQMTRVVLPATIKRIGQNAFLNCTSLTTVVSHIQSPFVIDDNTFSISSWSEEKPRIVVSPSPATLFVPEGTKSKYEATTGWTMFAKIVEGEPIEATINGVKYMCDADTKTAKVIADDGHKELTAVNIPAQIEVGGTAYQVTEIGKYAFYNCSRITTLTLPTTIKTIEEYAFSGCGNINEFIIQEGCETIGERAFSDMFNLQKVELPSTLTSIGNYAFYDCSNLESVVSHIQMPFAISDQTFMIYYWNETEGEPERKPSPATLFVPEGTKSKYEATTGWTMFAKIVEGEPIEATINGVKYMCDADTKTAKVIADDGHKELTAVNIPAQIEVGGTAYQVTEIGKYAFYNCSRITTLTLPTTIKTIEEYAFSGCGNINEFIIQEGCETIGERAFSDMFNLQKVELPSTLTSIGNYAFYDCSNLESVVSHIQMPFAISDQTFMIYYWNETEGEPERKPSPATLFVPEGTKSKYEATTGWTMFAKILEREPFETIVNGFKYKCFDDGTAELLADDSYKNLTVINIPAQIEVDGQYYQVEKVGKNAFEYCYKVTLLTLPTTVKEIDNFAFQGCSGIQEITIPEGCVSIGEQSFYSLSSLRKVELPTTLTSIGYRAFSHCHSLESVISSIQTPFTIKNHTFSYTKWNGEEWDDHLSPATLYIPAGTKTEYLNKGWNQFTDIVESETLGINNISSSTGKDRDKVYNIQGQRIDNPVKGIYIKHGKKILLR